MKGPKGGEGESCLQLPTFPLHALRKTEHSRTQEKDKEEEQLWTFIHYFQDNQSTLEVSQIFPIQKEEFETIQKEGCLPNSSCMCLLAVKTEVENKGKRRSSTGKKIIAKPRSYGQEQPPYDFMKSFTFSTLYKYRAE